MTERANVIIVGGGVVGCAIAAELGPRCDDVFVLEALPRLGQGASTRNSGVIHSGVYYPPASLKARFCLEGNRLTYHFCATHDVPHWRTGKLIVATTPGEETQLELLLPRGRENGVEDLELIPRSRLSAREPHIAGCAALWVPSAGLLESERLVQAFAAVAQQHGVYVATHARVTAAEPTAGGVRITATEVGALNTRVLINAAGLFADDLAALLGNHSWRIHPCRGEYYEVLGPKAELVRGLVYPAPDPNGLSLGVHLTRTLASRLLLGPNARYVESKDDYEHDVEPPESFCARARKLLPQLEPEDLRPGYSGLRAKLAPPERPGAEDFVVTRDPNYPHVIHLVGIESPGLTAAPALARYVAGLVAETLA